MHRSIKAYNIKCTFVDYIMFIRTPYYAFNVKIDRKFVVIQLQLKVLHAFSITRWFKDRKWVLNFYLL